MAASTSSATGGAGGAGAAGGAGGAMETGPFRSVLYPADWTPAFQDAEGRFLHDFSYAGFHYGEEPKAFIENEVNAVTDYGADPLGAMDSTMALQTALDAIANAGGGVVLVPSGKYRVDGVLEVKASNVVLRGEGPNKTKLQFTKTAGMSDRAHIQFQGALTSDLEVPLAIDGESRTPLIYVDSGAGLSVGDEISLGFVITPEFIEEHEMTGTWQAFNDTWQTFFRRTVIAVDVSVTPNQVTLDVPLRYPLKMRDSASLRRESGYLSGVGVEGIGVSNAASWDEAWSVTRTHAIGFRYVEDAFVRDIQSFESAGAPTEGKGKGAHLLSGGILVLGSKRVTVSNVELAAAENRGSGGNGYLFEIMQSNEVLIKDSVGTAGRHNFIQNWGFGTTGCVFLRVTSREGKAFTDKDTSLGLTSLSEYHHSLATANLVDSSLFDDGFSTVNRNHESTGAGHSGTQDVFWNTRGKGMLRSLQFGTGYIIGTTGVSVVTESVLPMGEGTAPIDYVEGKDRGDDLMPTSLYEDQRIRRLVQP